MTKVYSPQQISVTDLPMDIGLDRLLNIKDTDSLSPKSRSRAPSTGRPGELAGLRSRHRGNEESSEVTRSPAESSRQSFESTSSPKLRSRFVELLSTKEEKTWSQKAENLKQKTAVEPFVNHLGVGEAKSKTATARFADHLAGEDAKLKTDVKRFIDHLAKGIDAQADLMIKLVDEAISGWDKYAKHDVQPEAPKQSGKRRRGTFSSLASSLQSIGRRRSSSTQSMELNNQTVPGVAAAAVNTTPASSAKQQSKLRTRSASVDNFRNGFSTLTRKLSVKRRKSMSDTVVTSRPADESSVPPIPTLPDHVKARKPKR
ncbi:hypothetical protein KQH49_02555 [Mycetohabitans sp. B5]|uniref:Uncharacterized protein n=1 Tax=Mycetohabitans endofungorum TaxID=417203 RepID=A0A2P5KED4_9BURK|nr:MULTISPECIES: hypothetical protein [Mycetohabitans]MCG1053906.1 hypothetical protein [Mycetohabitans sp. B5]PPB85073.1 hypothetical protein B0O95_101160 [Mycetohabitans endofungorum]